MLEVSVPELGVIVVCGVASGYALVQVARSVRASRWPSVEGEIADTRLVRAPDNDGGTQIEEYVAYRYTVNGLPYRNDRLRFGPQVAAPSPIPGVDPEPRSPRAKAILEQQYPRGQRVRVYYNPARPEDSVLNVAPSPLVWVILVAAGVFAYAALFGHR